jgi:hypothetical protein
MDLTTTFCPHQHCPARGQTGPGHLGLHSQKEPRCLCPACPKTCSARPGTVFDRLRPSAEPVMRVVTVLAQGCPLPALVAAWGCDARTRAEGWARSGRPGHAVHAYLVAPPRDWGQGPAAALRGKQQGGIVWLAWALRGTTRVWRGGEVSAPRDLPLSRQRRERVRRGAAPGPLVCWTAGWRTDSRAMRATCRAPVRTGKGGRPRRRPWRHVLLAPVVKRDARRRGVDPERRMVEGPPARGETLRRRAQGDGGSKTASMERLNATCRERLAPLARRCRALARQPQTRHEGMCVVGTVYNFCTPHESLHAGQKTTLAMAAGITDHGWTMQELLSFPVPLPRWVPPKQRGRPSRALQRRIERWCS